MIDVSCVPCARRDENTPWRKTWMNLVLFSWGKWCSSASCGQNKYYKSKTLGKKKISLKKRSFIWCHICISPFVIYLFRSCRCKRKKKNFFNFFLQMFFFSTFSPKKIQKIIKNWEILSCAKTFISNHEKKKILKRKINTFAYLHSWILFFFFLGFTDRKLQKKQLRKTIMAKLFFFFPPVTKQFVSE